MAIEAVPVTYRTSDGSEFTVKADAEVHEELTVALERFREAGRELGEEKLQSGRQVW